MGCLVTVLRSFLLIFCKKKHTVMSPHCNHVIKMVQMRSRNVCFLWTFKVNGYKDTCWKTKGNKFCDILFASQVMKPSLPKIGATLKGNNLLLREQILFFEGCPILDGQQNGKWQSCSCCFPGDEAFPKGGNS